MASEIVEVVEVGLRDGLQSQPTVVSIGGKLSVLGAMVEAGISRLELGSFVRPDRVPQMASTPDLFRAVDEKTRTQAELIALVPNVYGAHAAVQSGATSIRMVLSASEGHSKSNTGRSVDEGIAEAVRVGAFAQDAGVKVAAAMATAFVCPFDGVVSAARVVGIVKRLSDAGYTSISLADTLGRANPAHIRETVNAVRCANPQLALNLHLHNTYGMGIANVVAALEVGIRSFDASVAGIGGCPFAPGAAGNIATEELVFILHDLGYLTGVALEPLGRAVRAICDAAQCQPSSSVARVLGWTT